MPWFLSTLNIPYDQFLSRSIEWLEPRFLLDFPGPFPPLRHQGLLMTPVSLSPELTGVQQECTHS